MDTQTTLLLGLWEEARTRLDDKLQGINAGDLSKKLVPSPNSLGFLIRHIAEVELLFAKNVFGARETKVIAKTVIAQHDTGEWTDLEALKEILARARKSLKEIIEQQSATDWQTQIKTAEFGTKTKAQALGRITSHTSYHAGQIGLIIKYGTIN